MTRLIGLMLIVFGFALAFSSITVAEEASKYVGGSPAVGGAHPFFFIPVDELTGKKAEVETITEKKVEKEKKF